jgi:hypothetical protein
MTVRSMAVNDVKVLKLWCDNRGGATRLHDDLVASGYKVRRVFSGSEKPVAACDGVYVHGIPAIRAQFVLREAERGSDSLLAGAAQ